MFHNVVKTHSEVEQEGLKYVLSFQRLLLIQVFVKA